MTNSPSDKLIRTARFQSERALVTENFRLANALRRHGAAVPSFVEVLFDARKSPIDLYIIESGPRILIPVSVYAKREKVMHHESV